jgi:hypothetical protein
MPTPQSFRLLRLLVCRVALVSLGQLVAGETTMALAPFREVGKDAKWGYADNKGKLVIQANYDNAQPFSEGLAAVGQGKLWGYIDVTGAVVIPTTLSIATSFSEGLAGVYDNSGWHYIDTRGKTAFAVSECNSLGKFCEGLAAAYKSTSVEGQDGTTQYFDKQGNLILSITGFGGDFHEGLAELSILNSNDKSAHLCGFIDKQGKTQIQPLFAEVMDFSEGLAVVRPKKTTPHYYMGDAWGFIDKAGKYVIEPHYNQAFSFIGGFAIVHSGGEIKEARHVPPYFVGGEWLLIDKKGQVLKRGAEYKEIETECNALKKN